jgi:hypothetical protein
MQVVCSGVKMLRMTRAKPGGCHGVADEQDADLSARINIRNKPHPLIIH